MAKGFARPLKVGENSLALSSGKSGVGSLLAISIGWSRDIQSYTEFPHLQILDMTFEFTLNREVNAIKF